jgi:hypothetical protein
MGAEPWATFTKYDSDIQRALDHLRNEVFAAGEYRYAEETPSSIEEAREIADADGTCSVLDIDRISPEPDFCCAAPFTPTELKTYFGTDRPTRADIEDSEDYWDDLERGQARYAVVYEEGTPSELYFAGYSFD